MDKAQRKRHAAIAAVALLEWRDHMARENANRENAEREVTVRYGLMIAAMAEEADKPRAARQTPCKTITAKFRGDGAAGVLS
jgi:hypothetical protein